MLTSRLHQSPHVVFAGYKVPHPLVRYEHATPSPPSWPILPVFRIPFLPHLLHQNNQHISAIPSSMLTPHPPQQLHPPRRNRRDPDPTRCRPPSQSRTSQRSRPLQPRIHQRVRTAQNGWCRSQSREQWRRGSASSRWPFRVQRDLNSFYTQPASGIFFFYQIKPPQNGSDE